VCLGSHVEPDQGLLAALVSSVHIVETWCSIRGFLPNRASGVPNSSSPVKSYLPRLAVAALAVSWRL
jgi:hypothetical protein